jgi:hypothetical protein
MAGNYPLTAIPLGEEPDRNRLGERDDSAKAAEMRTMSP